MRYFFFDYETFCLAPGVLAPPPVCMSYAYDLDAPKLVHARDPEFRRLLEEAVFSDAILVAHNAAFEMVVTMAYEPKWSARLWEKMRLGQVRCTMVREKLIRVARGDHTDGFALDECSRAWHLSFVPDKSCVWRLRYGELWDVPLSWWPKEAVDYALGDVCVRDLYFAQETCAHYLHEEQYRRVRAATTLALTSARGFATDKAAATVLLEETEVRLAEYQETVLREGLARWEKKKGVLSVVKTKAAAEERIVKAYAAMGREAPRGEPTEKMCEKWAAEQGLVQGQHYRDWSELKESVPGNLSLDAEACENSGDPILLAYTRFSQASTLRSKVRRLQHSPIQTSYNVLVATGRTSSRQGDDPAPGKPWVAYGMQVQNLPRVGEEVDG